MGYALGMDWNGRSPMSSCASIGRRIGILKGIVGRVMIKSNHLTQPKDIEYRIIRLQARKLKHRLTPGEKRQLQWCYDWLEKHYSDARNCND